MNKKIIRTEREIADKISEITKDGDNFTSDNYGSESADNGDFEVYYSEYNSTYTMTNFVKWLTNNDIK